MSLSTTQQEFAQQIAILIIRAGQMGYAVTLGDAYRDPKVFGAMAESKGYGRSTSAHKQRLAVDLNLFKDGKYLDETSDHQKLGEVWESMHPDNVWGGRFNDGNHYSRKYGGIA